MKRDVFERLWRQMRGQQVRAWWGKLTEDDLDQVGGKYDRFIGLIQEKYGYSRARAENELDKRLAEYAPLRNNRTVRLNESAGGQAPGTYASRRRAGTDAGNRYS